MAVAGLFRPKGQVACGPFRVASLLQFAVSGALFQIGLFRCFDLLGITAIVLVTVCLPPVISQVWTLLRGQAQISASTLGALAMAVIGLYGFAPAGLFTDGNIDWGIPLAVMASGGGNRPAGPARPDPPFLSWHWAHGAGLSLLLCRHGALPIGPGRVDRASMVEPALAALSWQRSCSTS